MTDTTLADVSALILTMLHEAKATAQQRYVDMHHCDIDDYPDALAAWRESTARANAISDVGMSITTGITTETAP